MGVCSINDEQARKKREKENNEILTTNELDIKKDNPEAQNILITIILLLTIF